MIGVVIPARDEGQLIGRCLESVVRAGQASREPVVVIVVADACADDTADVARGFPGVRVVEVDAANVGAARAAGAIAAIEAGADWLANTDADSVVPADWLVVQWAIHRAGADVIVGTVRPDFGELDEEQTRAWSATHAPGRPNGHVHGANLGVAVGAYLGVGGYESLAEHEDTDLVARLGGHAVVATDRAEVVTSARRFGRTPGGYARFLREDLVAERAGLQ